MSRWILGEIFTGLTVEGKRSENCLARQERAIIGAGKSICSLAETALEGEAFRRRSAREKYKEMASALSD